MYEGMCLRLFPEDPPYFSVRLLLGRFCRIPKLFLAVILVYRAQLLAIVLESTTDFTTLEVLRK
jgi:hypothetical protein